VLGGWRTTSHYTNSWHVSIWASGQASRKVRKSSARADHFKSVQPRGAILPF